MIFTIIVVVVNIINYYCYSHVHLYSVLMVNQEKKFPSSALLLVSAGHKSLAIFHISRTLCGILAVPCNAVFYTCPEVKCTYSEVTYSGLTMYSTCNQLVQQCQLFYRLYPPSPELQYLVF